MGHPISVRQADGSGSSAVRRGRSPGRAPPPRARWRRPTSRARRRSRRRRRAGRRGSRRPARPPAGSPAAPAHGVGGSAAGTVEQHSAPAVLEERVVVDAARRPGRGRPTAASSSAFAPAYHAATASPSTSSSIAATVASGTALSSTRSGTGSGVEEPSQGHDGGPGPIQLGLQPREVVGHQRGTAVGVGRLDDAPDVGEGYVELAEAVDHLGRRDLVGVVGAVARERGRPHAGTSNPASW